MAYILPAWPAPDWLGAASSLRFAQTGASQAPWHNFNLGTHVGDQEAAVQHNRQHLSTLLALRHEPLWLNQVHGNRVLVRDDQPQDLNADACVAFSPGPACLIMTADCLPILVCDRRQRRIAAIHAGWRSLSLSIIEATLARMNSAAEDLMVWLGPAIGPTAFEVGPEVRETFVNQHAQAATAFQAGVADRWLADIAELACQRLRLLGVKHIYRSGLCTYQQPQRFFSFRRDGQTGRMASLIWLRD